MVARTTLCAGKSSNLLALVTGDVVSDLAKYKKRINQCTISDYGHENVQINSIAKPTMSTRGRGEEEITWKVKEKYFSSPIREILRPPGGYGPHRKAATPTA